MAGEVADERGDAAAVVVVEGAERQSLVAPDLATLSVFAPDLTQVERRRVLLQFTAHQPSSSLHYETQGIPGWLGSRVVSVLRSGAEGPGFRSQPRRCRVTVLGKLFTPIVPLFTKQRNCYRPTSREGNCGPGGK